jgi:hypothetical protein
MEDLSPDSFPTVVLGHGPEGLMYGCSSGPRAKASQLSGRRRTLTYALYVGNWRVCAN